MSFSKFISLSAIVMCFGLGLMLVKIHEQQKILENQVYSLQRGSLERPNTEMVTDAQVIERVVGTQHVWSQVQKQVENTVVQIFTQVAEIDFLQPYKTPSQYTGYGSGFFIDEEGYFVTNAHVVNQAKTVWIQISALGKHIIDDIHIIGVSPERDLALLKVGPHGLGLIKSKLGKIPVLPLADSDKVRRADEVMALGYPLGQQSLKSTTGVISGCEGQMIQMSAPINPGNSGGPLLNINGEVIGINTSGVVSAQNVGYIIPINSLKLVLEDLKKVPLLRKPYLGVLFNNANETLTEYLGNPQPGGCYVVDVIKNSTLYKAGVQSGDMIYEINGLRVDLYGDMTVPWSEDKVSVVDYVSRLAVGQEIKLVIYRHGKRKEVSAQFTLAELPAIRKVYPGFEEIDYELFAGIVVMPLSLNHIHMLANVAPGLIHYTEMKNQTESVLIVTHVLPTSQLHRVRSIVVGCTLSEVNGIPVTTLAEYRKALKATDGNRFIFKASDHFSRISDNVLAVIPYEKVLEDELRMSQVYRYTLSDTAKDLLQEFGYKKQMMAANGNNQLKGLSSGTTV